MIHDKKDSGKIKYMMKYNIIWKKKKEKKRYSYYVIYTCVFASLKQIWYDIWYYMTKKDMHIIYICVFVYIVLFENLKV